MYFTTGDVGLFGEGAEGHQVSQKVVKIQWKETFSPQ